MSLFQIWRNAASDLSRGLSEEANALLFSMGCGTEAVQAHGLHRFTAKANSPEGVAPRVVLRLRATRVRWRHTGVRVDVKSATLEINGLPVARIKLCTGRDHRKGRNFAGSKRVFVRFDHRGAVKPRGLLSEVLSNDASCFASLKTA